MVLNKRSNMEDFKSPVMFSHKYILEFLERHHKYVNNSEVVKIFILSRRFRLSLIYLQQSGVPFEIEFFTNAIEANAYDIAFYLLKVYDENIRQDYQMAIESHV